MPGRMHSLSPRDMNLRLLKKTTLNLISDQRATNGIMPWDVHVPCLPYVKASWVCSISLTSNYPGTGPVP